MKLVFLLIDRFNRADDNAEFFYKWLAKNRPDIEIHFGLSRKSADWPRLECDGVRLLDLDSGAIYSDKMKTITHIFVSNPDDKIKKLAPQAVRVFLQHGITNRRAKASADYIKDCLKWADYMLATSEAERELLATAPYSIDRKKILVTGFPRHDALCNKAKVTGKKYICFQPHWAMYLDPKANLLTSDYFIGWTNLLASPQLKDLCDKYNVKAAFRLHPCSFPLEKHWLKKLPDYIKYIDKTESFQKTFAESLLYVSDYSSNMFEVGLINTPCIYYRPDAEYVRKCTTAGDFEKNILGIIGPTTYTVDQFIEKLADAIKNNFSIQDEYKTTRAKLFPYMLDTNNCSRVLNTVLSLYKKHLPPRLNKIVIADGRPNTYLYF